MNDSIEQASLEQIKYSAAKHLYTPISFTGMFTLVWPLWYSVALFFLFGVPSLLYTQSRRHHLRAARAVLAGRSEPTP